MREGGGVLAILRGDSFKVVLTWELEVLAILQGGAAKCFHSLKGGHKRLPLS